MLLISCQFDSKSNNSHGETDTIIELPNISGYISAEDSLGIHEYLKEVDHRMVLDSGSSLVYTDNNYNNYKAKVFFTKEKSIKKLVGFIDYANNSKLINTYYFHRGIPIFSKSEVYSLTDTITLLQVTKEYYDSLGNVVRTIRSNVEKSANRVDSQIKNTERLGHKDFMSIINQKNNFTTGFRGFTEMNGIPFLIVGTDTYRATLKVPDQLNSQDFERIKENPNTFVGCELMIEFLNFIDDSKDENHVLYNLKLLSPCE